MASQYDAITTILMVVFHNLFNAMVGYVTMATLESLLRVTWAPNAKVADEREKRVTAEMSSMRAAPNSVVSKGAFETLPVDIDSSVAMFFDASDIAQLGGTCNVLRDRFWGSLHVWRGLSAVHGFSLPADQLTAPEHFRMNLFHIVGDGPQTLLAGAMNGTKAPSEILEEGAYMLRGLLPHDNMSIVNCILEAGESALWSLEVGDTAAKRSADCFLESLRQSDCIMLGHVAHIEEVLRTTDGLRQSVLRCKLDGNMAADSWTDLQSDVDEHLYSGLHP